MSDAKPVSLGSCFVHIKEKVQGGGPCCYRGGVFGNRFPEQIWVFYLLLLQKRDACMTQDSTQETEMKGNEGGE